MTPMECPITIHYNACLSHTALIPHSPKYFFIATTSVRISSLPSAYRMISANSMMGTTGTPNSRSISCTVESSDLPPRSCRSTSCRMPTRRASGWDWTMSMASRTAFCGGDGEWSGDAYTASGIVPTPLVKTSSMMTIRPFNGAPTSTPPSPCCVVACQLKLMTFHNPLTSFFSFLL